MEVGQKLIARFDLNRQTTYKQESVKVMGVYKEILRIILSEFIITLS